MIVSTDAPRRHLLPTAQQGAIYYDCCASGAGKEPVRRRTCYTCIYKFTQHVVVGSELGCDEPQLGTKSSGFFFFNFWRGGGSAAERHRSNIHVADDAAFQLYPRVTPMQQVWQS